MHAIKDNKKREEKMKTKTRFTTWLLAALFTVAAAFAGAGVASAAGTASGTSISNTATINYTVGGVGQTPITSAATSFLVDDKVDFTVVSNDGGTVTGTPGSAAIAMKFTVTNTGNTTHDFNLSSIAATTNEFVASSVTFYDDVNVNGVYDSGVDNPISYIAELAADGTKVVFLVAAVPLTATNGQRANYALKVVAHQGGGAGLGALTTAPSGAADNPAVVQVVFADADSDSIGEDATADNDPKGVNGTNSIPTVIGGKYNGIYVIWGNQGPNLPQPAIGTGGYVVATAVITISKTSVVYSDPINGTTNPKAIPGAVIRYTISITNAAGAGASATLTTISDALTAAQLINAGASWTVTGMTAPVRTVASGAKVVDLADANADGIGHDTMAAGGTLTATLTTILVADAPNGYTAGELEPGETVNVVFDITIQ